MSAFSINLLPKKRELISDRIVYFGIHYFRYIIVITQIFVISVFFFRLKEDQKVIDLKKKFNEKQQILEITYPSFQEAEAIEKKIIKIESLLNKQDLIIKAMHNVLALVPKDIVLTSLTIKDNIVDVQGTSFNIQAVRAFHTKLSTNETFALSEIRSVDRISDSQYDFNINVQIKP